MSELRLDWYFARQSGLAAVDLASRAANDHTGFTVKPGNPRKQTRPAAADVKQDAASGGATDFLSVRQRQLEFGDYLHLARNSAQVAAGDQVGFDQHLADVGDTGAAVGTFHPHRAVTDLREGNKGGGGGIRDDPGGACQLRGLRQPRIDLAVGHPRHTPGQWRRRSTDTSPVRYTAAWQPYSEGEIQVYGWTYRTTVRNTMSSGHRGGG